MKFMLPLLALGYVALASPSLPVNPGGIGGIFKGPNSETIIKGPDGSVITSAAQGGEVRSELQPVIVAEPAVVQEVAPTVVATPVVTPIEAVPVPAPVVEPKQSSDLIGPSGRILTHGSQSVVAGPASTTVTGPAVVAETIVRGPPIVARPILNAVPVTAVTASPIATVTDVSLAPISVTAAPLLAGLGPVVTVTEADIAPISVTASPVNVATAALLTSVPSLGGSVIRGSAPISTIGVGPQGVATASTSSHGSSASASSTHGASATASVSPNVATASVNTDGNVGVTSVTASPILAVSPGIQISSTLSPQIQGLQDHGIVEINDQINLANRQLIEDQVAIDNRQLTLNQALIPTANIIPPEIRLVSKDAVYERLIPRPGNILTTPGLGTIGTTTNIQREEADAKLSVTPNNLQTGAGLTREKEILLQNGQILVNGQGVQNIHQSTLNPQVISVTPKNKILLAQRADPRLIANEKQLTTLANVQQQQLLNAELIKAGIDASQIQLTNVPLSAVSGLPHSITSGNLNGIVINDGLSADAWGRHGRDTTNKKN